MPRNLDRRIEVVVPVEDTHARNELEGIFKALLSNTPHSWELPLRRHVAPRLVLQKNERRRSAQATFHAPLASRPPVRSGPATPVLWRRHHGAVPVAVVDVGSNTVRLLVTGEGRELLSLARRPCGSGQSVERNGLDSPRRSWPSCSRAFGASPTRRGPRAHRALEVLVTSPGPPGFER